VTELGFQIEMEAQGFAECAEFCGPDISRAISGCKAIVVMTEFEEFAKYNYS
jgi:hypothetical protein